MKNSELKLSVIVPVFNEEGNLRELHRELVDVLEQLGVNYEIIFVDDGSTDGSFAVLCELASSNSRTRVIRLQRNFGQTAALRAGVDHAHGEVLVFIDADLQNDPADIPRLLAKLNEGYDIVSGWRRHRKDAFLTKRIPSLIANWLISWLTGVHLHDYGCTLKAYRREALEYVRLYGEMHRLLPAYLAALGARVAEVEVNHRPRKWGRSKYGLERVFKVPLDIISAKLLHRFTTKPLYTCGGWGIGFLLLGLVTLVAVIFGEFTNARYTAHLWVITAVSVISGIHLIMLGLLGEVIMRTYYESQGRTPYVIRETINVD